MSEPSQGEPARDKRAHSSSETARATLPERATQLSQSAADAAVHRIQVVRGRAQSAYEHQRERAASTIERVSRAIEFVSDEVRPQDESAAEYLEQTSERMRQVATYVSSATPATLRKDATNFAREYPGLALGGSFLAGVVIGRFLHASTPSVGPAGLAGETRSPQNKRRSKKGRGPIGMAVEAGGSAREQSKASKKYSEHS
jgi:ElaB/YqjD/DUF883 family membrane-anchored ribosome-binding protein